MGNDQSILKQKQLNIPHIQKYVKLSQKHNQKIFKKKVKNFEEFTFIIKTIYLRTSYLKYNWAKWLCNQLIKDNKKLYDAYCLMFKQNLLIKHAINKNFEIKQLQSKYFQNFEQNVSLFQINTINLTVLDSLFQQAKCYLMVINWFGDLPIYNKLESKQQQQSNYKQNNSEIIFKKYDFIKKNKNNKLDSTQQKIYNLLLKSTQLYFDAYFINKLINNQNIQLKKLNESPQKSKNSYKNLNIKEMNLIRIISKQNNFKIREALILQLLAILTKSNLRSTQNLSKQIIIIKLKQVSTILGIKKVYCMLKLLKQVGSSQNQKLQFIFDIVQSFPVQRNINLNVQVVQVENKILL